MNTKTLSLIIILVIVIAGALGYFIFIKKSQPAIKIPSSASSQPSADQPVPTAQSETTNWKTYRNEKYKFEMKYPASIELREKYFGAPAENIFGVVINEGGHGLPHGFGYSTTTQVFFAGFNETKYMEWGVDKNEVDDPLIREDFAKTTFQRLSFEAKKDLNISFYFTCMNEKQECSNLFNQILATFKFTR